MAGGAAAEGAPKADGTVDLDPFSAGSAILGWVADGWAGVAEEAGVAALTAGAGAAAGAIGCVGADLGA